MDNVVALSVEDAGELLTLQRAAYVTEAQAHGDFALPPLVQSLEELTSELVDPEVNSFGFRDEASRLVAAVRVRRVDAHTAELGRLIVAPDVQGRGLGSRLLRLTERRLPAEIAELQLFTGERSVSNLRLYMKLGYEETHREPTPGGYSLVYLRKRVG